MRGQGASARDGRRLPTQAEFICLRLASREANPLKPRPCNPHGHAAMYSIELAGASSFVKYGGLKFLEASHVKICWQCCGGRTTPESARWIPRLQCMPGMSPASQARARTFVASSYLWTSFR
jgi:hypothetical protein